jgi:hypothetical protein
MGTAPPPDGPSVVAQGLASANAGFSTSAIPAASLCGFTLPFLSFSLSFHLPALAFPPPFPIFGISFGLNCSLDNPINVSASLPYGGGRIGTSDPDVDDSFDQAA